jgi:hypothetical protein
VPGQPHYETVIDVDFYPEGEMTRMVVTLHPHLDPEWTRMSAEGFGSQLTKLDQRYGWARGRTVGPTEAEAVARDIG